MKKETQMLMEIPKQIIHLKTKKTFMDARHQMMRRSCQTQAYNKTLVEWTLPNMMVKAKEEEKLVLARIAAQEKAALFKK